MSSSAVLRREGPQGRSEEGRGQRTPVAAGRQPGRAEARPAR